MTAQQAHDHARRVADAILYEGYLLYPYRQSAQKNRSRFQFGVLMPPAYGRVDGSEMSACQTECVLECGQDAEVDIMVRFLQLQRREVYAAESSGGFRAAGTLRVDASEFTSWDEAKEREERFSVPVASLLAAQQTRTFRLSEGETAEDLRNSRGQIAGRVVRRWDPVAGAIVACAERAAGPYGAVRLRVRVENRTLPAAPLRNREDGIRHALIAAHTLIGVCDGTFLSMTDPPEWAAAYVAACENIGTWPVLAGPAGDRSLMLSSPVILYDHPQIAPESAGELFDATEIDEILTLRTLALTDEEKKEARATDPRAAGLIDRLDHLPPEMIERMHGAIRYLAPASSEPPSPAGGPSGAPPAAPWWDPGADTSVSPETDHVMVGGVRVARGSKVRMRPGPKRADAQDLFLAGREAVVEAVLHDVDGEVHVAVCPSDDPAADLQRSHGRFLYFDPGEIEPLD